MINKMYRICIAAFLIFAVFAGCMPQTFAAEKDANNLPEAASIEVERVISGNANKAGKDTFVLTAKEEAFPMPDGKFGGEKRITVKGEGTKSFGSITYTKPDVYEYIVERVKNKKKNVEKDYSRYAVKVIVLNTGEIKQVIIKDGTGKKSELVYEDKVKEPPIKTSDLFNPIIFGMICLASFACILFLLAKKRRERYEKI